MRSGSLADFNALGAVGNAVYASSSQLRATIRRSLGPDMADVLALPQSNDAGNIIDWYAPFDGVVVPWSAAAPDEREYARIALQEARERYHRHSGDVLAKVGERAQAGVSQEVFGRLLPLSLQIPDDSHIYLVNGRPVVTFWGFAALGAPPERDVIRDLAPPRIPAAASNPVGSDLVPPDRRRPWWWRWLWPLLALLLLLLLLFGLRACQVPLPGLGVSSLPNQPPIVGLPTVGVPTMDSAPTVPVVPGGQPALPSDAIPADPAAPAAGAPPPALSLPPMAPPAAPLQAPPPQPATVTPPPATPPAPPAPKEPPPAPAAAVTPLVKPPGLVLPPDAVRNGSVAFLDGHWRSRTGLMDSDTGRPIEVEYDFKSGKGTSTIHRSDGVACTAPSTAVMQGGKLMIEQTADLVCKDGQVFTKSRVECVPGKNGQAECRGLHGAKDKYFVEIVK